jgi:hypothetical protein
VVEVRVFALIAPRLVVTAYGMAIIGILLWQSLRSMARLGAVLDYLELRERRFPESRSLPVPPLARQAPMPYGIIAVVAAGVALVPLVIGLAFGSVGVPSIAIGAVAVVAAVVALVLVVRSPWAETLRLVWEAAVSEGSSRHERLEEALEADPQLHAHSGRRKGAGGGFRAQFCRKGRKEERH